MAHHNYTHIILNSYGGVITTYSVLDVAKYIIQYCKKENQTVTNLQLQKILYFCWINYYQREDKHLFEDDICAWQLGPVIPTAYYEYHCFAGMPIRIYRETPSSIDSHTTTIIQNTIKRYIEVEPWELVEITQKETSAWYEIYKNGEGLRQPIPFSLIKEKSKYEKQTKKYEQASTNPY